MSWCHGGAWSFWSSKRFSSSSTEPLQAGEAFHPEPHLTHAAHSSAPPLSAPPPLLSTLWASDVRLLCFSRSSWSQHFSPEPPRPQFAGKIALFVNHWQNKCRKRFLYSNLPKVNQPCLQKTRLLILVASQSDDTWFMIQHHING